MLRQERNILINLIDCTENGNSSINTFGVVKIGAKPLNIY